MSETAKIIGHMFVNLVKIPLDERISKQAASVVDGLVEKLMVEMPQISKSDWQKIRIGLCGMLAHGWNLGMHPYNSPRVTVDGEALEVRVSKDILIPIEALKALRYVKKDSLGRVEKAFFEPSAEARIKEQIEKILAEISKKHWTV
ncbi:MAG: hypothetical protein V1694_09975 [Candidatus Eisenbacteria bacterium]